MAREQVTGCGDTYKEVNMDEKIYMLDDDFLMTLRELEQYFEVKTKCSSLAELVDEVVRENDGVRRGYKVRNIRTHERYEC